MKSELFDEMNREFPFDKIMDFLNNGIDSDDDNLNMDSFLWTIRIIEELE